MAPGSLVGFALVFVIVMWTLSCLGALVVRVAAPGLRRRGPLAERRAVELAAVLPVFVAVAVTAAQLGRSAIGGDHCEAHDHHVHLCLAHGGAWLARGWAVALVTAAGATILARQVIVTARLVRAWARVARLDRAAVADGDGAVHLADSPRVFCFVAGLLRPRVYASTTAWAALPPAERAAVLAHELAHVEHGDLRRWLVLDALLTLGAPLTAGSLRATWARATERHCDARAAEVTGQPDAVASAMVRLCRLGAASPTFAFAGFTPAGAEIAERVRAVLAPGPDGLAFGRRLGLAGLALAILASVVAAALSEPLHHAFETLLG